MTEDERLAHLMASHLRSGATMQCAAAIEHVPWLQVMNWLHWADAGREPFVKCVAILRKAEAEAELEFTRVLYDGALDKKSEGNPRWALAWLERRRSEDWALVKPEKDASGMTAEETRDALAKELLKRADRAYLERLLEKVRGKDDDVDGTDSE